VEANILYLILLVIFFWLTALSVYTFNSTRNYKKLTRGVRGQTIERIMEQILTRYELTSQQIKEIKQNISHLQQKQKSNIQKVSLIRYNPFEDTGGDQSFVVALLDKLDNGIVISSLHSRGGTRVYAKQVSKGKSVAYKFSKEEKEVVEKAAQQS